MHPKRRNHRRILRLEALDQRRCLAADIGLSFSATDLDVNHDGHVTPQDALAVINALIQSAELRAVAGAGEGEAGSLDTDVNNDGVTAPGDAVIVINDLNDTSTPISDSTSTETPAPSDDSAASETANSTDTSDGSSGSNTTSSGSSTTTPTDETSNSGGAISSEDTSGTSTDGSDTSGDVTATDDSTANDSTANDASSDASGTEETGTETEETTDDGHECTHEDRLTTIFNDHDANQDGQLTEDEVPAGAWARLSSADTDGNGGISLEELTAAIPPQAEHHHGGEGGHHHGGEGSGNLFDRLDANDDGALTADEMSTELWDRLSPADADGNGSVSAEELAAYRPTPPSRTERLFDRLDANDDGALTADEMSTELWDRLSPADADGNGSVSAEELAAYRPTPPSRTERLFDRLDANDDGALTADEMSTELWDRLSPADADGNGSISAEELAAYHPQPASPVDHIFGRLDANEDGLLVADEVPEEVWNRLSSADSDGDGAVSKDELAAALPSGPHQHAQTLGDAGTTNASADATQSTGMGRPMGRPQGRMMGRR